jgi:uncharacterized protein YegJ (DUF2314 family)
MRKQDWQDHNKNKIIKIGDFVKIALQDGKSRAEHCWIKLTDVSKDGKTMKGILDNIPVIVKNYVYGDNVSLTRDDIEEHMTEDEDGC